MFIPENYKLPDPLKFAYMKPILSFDIVIEIR